MLHGKLMLYFAGFKAHYSLFAASRIFFAEIGDELKGYELRKGTIHFPLDFPLDQPVPVKLIRRIAKLRADGMPPRSKSRSPGGKAIYILPTGCPALATLEQFS